MKKGFKKNPPGRIYGFLTEFVVDEKIVKVYSQPTRPLIQIVRKACNGIPMAIINVILRVIFSDILFTSQHSKKIFGGKIAISGLRIP
ncbi:MAG: hypothetical protein Athens101428_239 [Candidatus Berkelbacteria bacterium Athens1014_28]|uniref:Uncharacterized protein n=1 Tax=Candidatus Berkelbacteria bacterium Athens1014_28 TaxID=2017145 RepID=A0A554LPQ7_9BACT|nr:MAG: hypothetical protein Athens101428_239 [Candidatus Berkelbacteria bacterium Athens1014_28]